MTAWICATCAVQQPDSPAAPQGCPICLDERQYVPAGGQRWTTLEELANQGHHSEIRDLEPDLLGIGVTPQVGIGQRALLVRGEAGGLLWDIPGFIDTAAIERVRSFCEVKAVSASHPHFYGVMAEWSRALGDVPMLIPEADIQWVQRTDGPITTWSDRFDVVPGITLLQCGGHFAGSAIVACSRLAEGRGALLTGDTLAVAADRKHVSVMRSYPNVIPVGAPQIHHIDRVLQDVEFDRIYAGWWSSVVDSGAKEALDRSKQRYLTWIGGAGVD